MALVYNAGTDREVTVAKACFASYYNDSWSVVACAYFNDAPVGFNIMPFVNAFKDDSTKNWVPLFKDPTYETVYGLELWQTNDIIYVRTKWKRGGTQQNLAQIASFRIGSFPSTYNIYLFYCNRIDNTSQYSYLYVSCGDRCTVLGVAAVQYGSSTPPIYKIGRVGRWENVEVTECGVGSEIPIPYTLQSIADNVDYLTYYPPNKKIAWMQQLYQTNTDMSQCGITYILVDYDGYDMDNLVDAQGDPPTPPTPPAPPWDDPNEQDPDYPSSPSDPEGDYERDYDPIPIPNKPTQGAATAGFITLYKLHQASMSQFASDMFASSLWEALKQFFGTPMDFLVGVNLLPFEPTAGPSFKPAYGPTAIFGHAYPTVANQYVDIDCGSVELKKYWGNCFDYEPYTKVQIWLPYIGYRDLPVDEIMGQTISVMYRCDCLTGDCVAFIYTGTVGETGPQVERVISQFYGNCAVRVPFGATSYDAAISNSIALMGAAASAGLSAGAGAIAEGGKIGAGLHAGINAAGEEMATNGASIGVVQGLKPNIHKGGAAGAATGYMSVQVPYLIRRIPRQSLPEGYMNLKGYPSNIGGKLADFTGLAIVDDIQLNNIPAMETERQEIISWLRGGVLI